MIIPNIWENNKCSKPPTRIPILVQTDPVTLPLCSLRTSKILIIGDQPIMKLRSIHKVSGLRMKNYGENHRKMVVAHGILWVLPSGNDTNAHQLISTNPMPFICSKSQRNQGFRRGISTEVRSWDGALSSLITTGIVINMPKFWWQSAGWWLTYTSEKYDSQ